MEDNKQRRCIICGKLYDMKDIDFIYCHPCKATTNRAERRRIERDFSKAIKKTVGVNHVDV